MTMYKLKEFREKFKLSQRAMASKLNITQAAYWKWENSKSLPDAKQILQLCEIFECTPNDLFGIKGVHEVALSKLREE